MADRYQSAVTVIMTAGAERAVTHGLTEGGNSVAPDEVIATFEHGASIGANSVRVTSKGTLVVSVILDKEVNPSGSPLAITCRLDCIRWHSAVGGR